MAREPNDLVLRILREIQATQADHSRVLEEHTRQFESLDRRMRELRESAITALGLAGHANVRNDSIERRLDDLEKRLETLEAPRT